MRIDPTEYNWHLRDIHLVVPRIRSDPTMISFAIEIRTYEKAHIKTSKNNPSKTFERHLTIGQSLALRSFPKE